MTRLPRNLTGRELIAALERVGDRVTRQTGSHIRFSCGTPVPHHATVPHHELLRIGTLADILVDVLRHQKISRDELIDKLLG
ncbi:type II toxin-antitoxin system HicA family toxin [Methylococcus sp. EFPC2]|uniref:type II toxin-antitoxin system HicA family toxin n=1 Tax=Methylococcus sp. EFPC2 TaxID=2812648 RepID=UPI001966D8B8|nr:type II toxin-antitoxin system HicA family toxin [Methylococcus sp. EFPC2]QSA96037.1 type II toxin-antitoxin system HicA family toxin [Methylococcus sp. EFPC2]